MKALTHNIPIFDYFLMLLSITKEDMESEDKITKLKTHLEPYFSESQISEIITNAKTNNESGEVRSRDNSSFVIFYNLRDRKTIIYGHEKRHVEDRVLRLCNISDKETAGYLAGYLSSVFEDFDKLGETVKYDYVNTNYNFKKK